MMLQNKIMQHRRHIIFLRQFDAIRYVGDDNPGAQHRIQPVMRVVLIQLIFPEINYDNVNRVRGLDIVIVTTANTDEESHELLAQFGMPFAR